MGGTAWKRFLVAGSIAATGGVLAGFVAGAVALGITIQLAGWATIAAALKGIRRWNPPRRLPWYLLTAAATLFLLAGIVRMAHGMLIREEFPFPSAADGLFAVGYLAIAGAELFLIRFRTADAERDHFVDAAIVAAGVGLLVWAAQLAPYVRDDAIPSGDRIVNTAFTALTLLVLAMTARLATGPGARNPSYYFLAGSISLVFVSDVLAVLETTGAKTGGIILALTPFSYLLFGAAALHPSMRELTDAPTDDEVHLTTKRKVLLAAALLMAPAVLVWQIAREKPIDLPVVVTGSVVLSLLVLARLSGLVRSKERTAERERVLREIGATLVVATSRDEILDGSLAAVLALASEAPDARAAVMLGNESELEVVASAGAGHPDPTSRRLEVASLPADIGHALRSRRAVALLSAPTPGANDDDPSEQSALLVVPLVSTNELRGAITVSTNMLLARETRRAIEALASEVALALESAALTEDLLRRRSEARFRTLIENSSDLVVVLGRDGNVSFVSPASHRLLGHRDDHYVGEDPLQFVHTDDQPAVVEALANEEPPADRGEPLEVRLAHADGTYRWFEMLSTDLRLDPDIQGLVVNAREITDRKGAEQLLARSEARFRSLVQNSSDVVAVIDDNAFFTYVSPAIFGMLGYKPDELVGSSVGQLLPEEEVRPAARAHAKVIDHPFDQASVETRVRDRDGEWHTVDVTITDLREEPAIEGIVLNARDVTVRKALEQDLRQQALHDGLTGLGNRAMFTDRVTHALSRRDTQHVVAVLFIDLDDFKVVNDSLGHEVGDELLIRVADRLGSCLRGSDTAARIGGDEFAVLLESSFNEEEVCSVADRVLGSMRSPFNIDGRELTITASVGIVVSPHQESSAEVMLRNADMAMYLAKDHGKDRFEIFEEAMHATVFERLELRTDLAHGIDNGQLLLHYQPIVSLETSRVVGVEALVRWDHPERGLMSPDTFVPLAEETGLVVPMGQWVLTEACEQLASWRAQYEHCPLRTVSVNLSVRQLQHESIVDTVADTLARTGLAPTDLVLEITESMLMTDTEMIRSNLSGLRGLGVSMAVDDFGTGYSSLGSIQYLPVDTIKIDKTFVAGLGQADGDESVVRAILGLAQGIGVRTVAEGIEGAEQLEALRALGCDYGQGYYFSRPLAGDGVADLLHAGVEGDVVGWEPAA